MSRNPASSSAAISYRADIDGLRAIAVLAVVLFHMDHALIPGGFMGVDMFFVISGYLITGILLRNMRTESFSLTDFYRKRILRILPALTLVIVVTLVVGQFVLLPVDLKRLAQSAVWSQLFLGNVYFANYLDISYFAKSSSLEPLLHLWSLGVEEQFYLIWPVLLLVGARYSGRGLFLGLLGLTIVLSFGFGQYYSPANPQFTYYMLPARIGTLLIGAACVYVSGPYQLLASKWAALVPCLGLLLIGYSLFVLSGGHHYPGLNAVPVALGAALLIVGGTRENPVSRILGSRLLVWFGLISYSMYLWHWPVLAYLKYCFGYLTPLALGASFIAIVILAWLSYRFVEAPCRSRTWPFRQVALRFFVLPSIVVVSLSAYLIQSSGYGVFGGDGRYAKDLRAAKVRARKAPSAKYVCQSAKITQELLETPDCIIAGEKEPRILLWGDSTAGHFVEVLNGLAQEYGFSFRNIAHPACPPVLTDPQRFTHRAARVDCEASGAVVRQVLEGYDVIMLSGNWEWYLNKRGDLFANELSDTITNLVARNKQVIVIGSIPSLPGYDRFCAQKAVKLPFLDCRKAATFPATAIKNINARVRAVASDSGARYVDFNRQLCSASTCSGYSERAPLYFDTIHLSRDGAVFVGEHVRKDERFAPVFEPLGDAQQPAGAPLPTVPF